MFLTNDVSAVKAISMPKAAFNRTRYNRMDYQDQIDYEKRMNETKTTYYAYLKNDENCVVEITKLLFEYCLSIGLKDISN
jgi:hypothetical protein